MDDAVLQALMEKRDEKYAAFQRRLLPTLPPESIIGVRVPFLRKLAKQLTANVEECVHYRYFEEKLLHAYRIALEKDFDRCMVKVEAFLPYVDNWAVCDQLRPGVFQQEKERLLPYIHRWLQSGETYTLRFAVVMLMQHYLEEDFQPEYLQWVAGIVSEEYYVNMAVAWYLTTALCKQWKYALPVLQSGRLNKWLQNKTIQKARESFMLTREQKEILGKLRKK